MHNKIIKYSIAQIGVAALSLVGLAVTFYVMAIARTFMTEAVAVENLPRFFTLFGLAFVVMDYLFLLLARYVLGRYGVIVSLLKLVFVTQVSLTIMLFKLIPNENAVMGFLLTGTLMGGLLVFIVALVGSRRTKKSRNAVKEIP